MASIGTVEGYLKLTDDFTTVLDRAMGALQKSTGMMNTNLAQMNAALNTTGQAAKQMGAAAKRAGDDVEVGARKAKSATGMFHDLRAAYALTAIGIWQFIDRTVAAQQASDRMRNSLLAGTGDIKIVGQELAFVRSESSRLGLDFAAAGVQYGKLTAASKGTGVAMKDVRAIFTAVAESATALGLSSEDTTGSLNAIVQMMTKGTVQAEELRGQLGDRLPGAVQAMSRALGVSNAEMMMMLEQGQVITADVLPRFAEELAKIGGSGVEAGAQSFNAELNKLKTTLFDLFSGIAGDVSLAKFVAGMREFVTVVDDLIRNGGGKAVFEDLSTAIMAALGGVGDLISLYTELVAMAEKAKKASNGPNLTPLGFGLDYAEAVSRNYDEAIDKAAEWASSVRSSVSAVGANMFSLVGTYKQTGTAAEQFFAEVAASGRALSSEDLVAFANKQNAQNLKEMQARLKEMTKDSLAFQKANSAAFDLEDKLNNQTKEMAVFQKMLKENGGNFELAKRNAASYYAVLKAGLDPLKGWGKQLYEIAVRNDAVEDSMQKAKKEAADYERSVKQLSKAFNKDWADAHKDALQATTMFGKAIASAMGQMEKFRTEADNYWGAIEASSRGADAVREFNKEAEIQAEIQARLGVRLTSNAELYDMYAAEIRESMGAMIDHRNEIEATLASYNGLADVLNNTDWGSDKMNDVASGLGQIMSALGKLSTATKLFSKDTAQAWAGMLNGITAVLEATGAFQTGNGGGFGGTSEGNYQAEGQMVGAIVGAIIGAFYGAPEAGAAIGGAAGGMLGGFIKKGAEEALATLEIDTTSFDVAVRKAEGGLGESINQLGSNIAVALMDIVGAIGGSIGSLPAVEMKIRDGVIGVVIGGVKSKFKEMDDAISFAVTELLKQGEILGIDAMLRNALQNTSSSSLEGLTRDMEAVMKVLSFGMTSSQQTIMSFTNELDGLRGQMIRLLTDTEQLDKAMGNLAIEEARRWQASRDAITGDKRTNAEKLAMLKQDGLMWNAEKALRIAELKMKASDLKAQIEILRGKVDVFKQEHKVWNYKYEFDRWKIQREMELFSTEQTIRKAELQQRGVIAQASLELLQVQMDAVNQMISVLENMPDIDVPNLRLPNVGGGGGGGVSGPSEAEQRARAFQEFLDSKFLANLPELARRLEEINRAYAEQAVAAAEVAGGTEALAAAREAELIQLRREMVDSLGLPLEETRDRFAALRETLAFLRDEVERTGMGGNRLMQIMREFGDVMEQELLGLATYFTDAMGDTEASAEYRRRLAEMEWDIRRAQFEMTVRELHMVGVLDKAQYQEWMAFLRSLPENMPDIITETEDDDPRGGNDNSAADDARQRREQALLTALERLRNALDKYRDLFADMQTNAASGRTLEQRSQNAYQQFQDMLLLAQGGDLDAIDDLPGAFNMALDLLGQFLDPSSSQFQMIRDQMLAAMEGIAGGIEGVLNGTQTPAEQAVTELRTIAEILNEIRALGWGNPNWNPGDGSARLLHGPQSHTGSLNGASSVMMVSAPGTDAAIAKMESRLATKIDIGFATLARATVRDTDKAEARGLRAVIGGRYGRFVEPDGIAG